MKQNLVEHKFIAQNLAIRNDFFLKDKLYEYFLEVLKTKYSIIIGEGTAEDLRRKIFDRCQTKIKICGRSRETGRKKAVHCTLADLL